MAGKIKAKRFLVWRRSVCFINVMCKNIAQETVAKKVSWVLNRRNSTKWVGSLQTVKLVVTKISERFQK